MIKMPLYVVPTAAIAVKIRALPSVIQNWSIFSFEIRKHRRSFRFIKTCAMKKYLLIALLFAFFGGTTTQAQGTFQPRQLDDMPTGIVYDRETTFNFTAMTNGWELGMDFGKIQTYYKTKYFRVSVGELKHPREKRSDFQGSGRPGLVSTRSYIFGKQNNLYTVRAGLGTKRFLSEKSADKGVAVGINYQYGPTLGLLKPYYLEVFVVEGLTGQNTRTLRYTEENAARFTNPAGIQGGSNRLTGFSELKPTLGLHGRFSVHFDWGAFDEFVKAMDVGVAADFFFQQTPIMVDDFGIDAEVVENRNLFLNLFVTLQFGKRK